MSKHMVEEALQTLFLTHHYSLSLAESCTGGAIAARLVQIPDCSLYFLGGIVAYSNMAKSRLLGVSPSLIKEKGAVSEEVAREMAKGSLRQFGTDIALSVTGVAGPSGGTDTKPVGMVCFSIAGKGEKAWTCHFAGNREEIILKSVEEALLSLLTVFKK